MKAMKKSGVRNLILIVIPFSKIIRRCFRHYLTTISNYNAARRSRVTESPLMLLRRRENESSMNTVMNTTAAGHAESADKFAIRPNATNFDRCVRQISTLYQILAFARPRLREKRQGLSEFPALFPNLSRRR